MRRTTIATLLVVLTSTVVAVADKTIAAPTANASTATSVFAGQITPPARPVALTSTQYRALQLLQETPEHSDVLGTCATYSAREKNLKFTRFSDDFWTAVYQVGWPGSYLAILLCAL